MLLREEMAGTKTLKREREPGDCGIARAHDGWRMEC